MAQAKYPEGTHFSKWGIVNEKNHEGVKVANIRRWAYFPDGSKKYERYPSKKYKHLRETPKELKNFVIRLNGENPDAVRVKRIVEFRHAYISPDLMDNYLEYLFTQIPSRKHALSEYSLLQRFCLNFFINKLRKPDPVEWHRHQELWAKALLNQIEDDDPYFQEDWRLLKPNEVKSAKTLRTIVNGTNRFMEFLHQKRPEEVPPLKFRPISKAAFKDVDARRKLAKQVVERKFIPDDHWEIIIKKAPLEIGIWAQIAYYYGLRRSEVMALDLEYVRNNYLLVERQLKALPEPHRPVYGVLKGKEERKVPHWFCKPREVYELINKVDKLMHPGTLSHKWLDFMREIGFDYDFHDIRHTWITKAIRLPGVQPRDVQLAAGHKNIETTMGYLHDDRIFGDDLFVPDDDELLTEAS